MPTSSPAPPRRRLPRLVHLIFLVFACFRTLVADRCPLRRWLVEVLRRLGLWLPRAERCVWVHGEGLGEFNAARRLLALILEARPGHRLLLTSSRPSTLAWLQAHYPDAVCLPLPWDVPPGVARFFRRLNPELVVLLEFADAFPPAALIRARRAGVPVVVVNARQLLDPKPLRYRLADRLGLTSLVNSLVDLFCAQDSSMPVEFKKTGFPTSRVRVTGNLKFDCVRPDSGVATDILRRLAATLTDPVLVAGCIHPDEESLVLTTYLRLRNSHPELRLLIAPLKMSQVPALAEMMHQRGLSFTQRSRDEERTAPVLILDTFGELASVYRVATVVLLGGSLTPRGAGHSLAEPAAQDRAIVVGPFMSSQTAMVEAFLARRAVVQTSVDDLAPALDRLLSDEGLRRDMGERALAVVAEGTGSTARTFEAIQPFLPNADPRRPSRGPSLMKRLVKTAAMSSLGQTVLSARARRHRSWNSLRDRLGDPRSILCLGNGPSSEDARLTRLEHDCLFRVNWRWVERGLLTDADVVFTGDYQTLHHCPGRILGFRTVEEETLMLLRSLLVPRLARVECVTLERLPSVLDERRWPARPTNGAVMIAAAVALQPRRLIVAGIDLFRHPDGGYPGDAHGPNRYAAVHAVESELSILRWAFDSYLGELIVISDPLRDALGIRGRIAA